MLGIVFILGIIIAVLILVPLPPIVRAIGIAIPAALGTAVMVFAFLLFGFNDGAIILFAFFVGIAVTLSVIYWLASRTRKRAIR